MKVLPMLVMAFTAAFGLAHATLHPNLDMLKKRVCPMNYNDCEMFDGDLCFSFVEQVLINSNANINEVKIQALCDSLDNYCDPNNTARDDNAPCGPVNDL